MRFVTYKPKNQVNHKNDAIGVVIGDKVAPLTSIDEFYADLDMWKEKAKGLTQAEIPVSELTLAPPVPRDAKIICMAINYVDHGVESKLPTPGFPNLFARWTAELSVDGTKVPVPNAENEGLDWEVELAAIVGSTLTDVDKETAGNGIFGYTIANDISGRLSQINAMTLSTGQWALGKNVEKSGGIGSFVETADAVDITNIDVEAVVDGKVMQSANTRDFIFTPGELLAYASRHVTLRPGDLFFTGTPAGVGFGLNPRRFMQPGSEVTVSAKCGDKEICSITHYIVDSSHRG